MRSVLYLWGPWHLFLPSYTYCSGDVQTTVDYILMDVESASKTTSSVTEMSDLSTSDHFLLAVFLVYSTVPIQDTSENQNAMPFRAEAERSGAVLAFSTEIGHKLEPLFSNLYDDPSQIGTEIEQSSRLRVYFKSVLVEYCPVFNQRLAGGGVMTLNSLCAKSRQAMLEWERAWCPIKGPLHLEKNRLRMLSESE